MQHGLLLQMLCFIGFSLALVGCKSKESHHKDENLQSIEAADRKLADMERELIKRRGALQRERSRIRDKRTAIITKKAALKEDDTLGKKALEQEESKLANLEASLIKQEMSLNKKLQSLIDEKTGLVAKLSKDKDTAARGLLIARREYSVAMRERDVSRREHELARREKELAAREQALALRQAKLCPRGGSVQVVHAPAKSGAKEKSYTRRDVEPVFRTALKAMQSKGILTVDLPPGVDQLITETRHGVAKGEYVKAKYAADQLLATVRKMKIDRNFIGAKINRLSNVIRRKRLRASAREKVNQLFQQATVSYGDGRFIDANQKLNRIYSLLN